MPFRIIEKKLKEPAIPFLCISRKRIFSAFNSELAKNKKILFVKSISGYGKTIAVRKFFLDNQSTLFWYSLDDWDKDPVTFLNYLYQVFKKKIPGIPDKLEEYFSQPLNSDSLLKSFIGQLSNELEARLKENSFLILDNFQEIQNEEVILKIISFLFSYCPDNLKIIILSNSSLPKAFYPFYLKQELYELEQDFLFLEEDEATEIFDKLNLDNPQLQQELLKASNKIISLFILLAQNIAETSDFVLNYQENKIYKNAVSDITLQIYQSFSANLQDFILKTIMLPRISIDIISHFFGKEDIKDKLEELKKHGILYQDELKLEFHYNNVFVPALEEIFFSVDIAEREKILDNILKFSQSETPENLIQALLRAKSYNKIVALLEENYESYFRNYLYETLSKIVTELKKHYPDNDFLTYLDIRIKRSTGKLSIALEQIKMIKNKTPLILLEEGICEAALGHFKDAIIKLKELESENTFKLKDQLTLINGMGISYLHNHELEKALNYFNKAISIKNNLLYTHDLIKIYHNLGLAYTWRGEFLKAIESYQQSLYMSKQLKVLSLAMTYNNLSIIHNLQGDYEKAYLGCIEGLEIIRKLKNNIDEIFLYLTLTEAYRGLKNNFKVEECINILESLLIKTPNVILDALLLKQKAYSALDKNDIESAHELMLKAINIRRLNEGDPSFIEYKLEIAIISFHAKDYKSAIEALSSIEINVREGEHKYHLARIYVYKTLSFFESNDLKNYEKYKSLAEEIIEKYNYTLLREKVNFQAVKTDISGHEQFKISTFGELDISFAGTNISKKDWSGKKTKLLFIYLLLNKTGISKDQIQQALFPEGDQSRSALHVLINRLRKALSGLLKNQEIDLIQFSDDVYRFNFSINYWWDAERFDYLIKEANKLDIKEGVGFYEQALSLYKEHFMSGLELEDWIFTTQEYYRQLAYKTYNILCNHYYSNKEFEKMLELSNHIFKLDNCFEKACENKMKALVAMNRKNDALKQYDILVNSLNKILNEEPSREIKEYKEQLLIKKK